MSDAPGELRQRSGVEVRPYAKGAVLVDMTTGRCFRLNKVGAEIWTMLAEPCAIDEICRLVAGRYQTPLEKVTSEIHDLVEHLTRESLVVSNQPGNR